VSTVVRVREERHDGAVVAVIEGEVDAVSVGEVAISLRRIVENQLYRVVIDLTGVSYLDSAGINLLFSVGGDVRARQQELHLVIRPGSPIERMLHIVGADRSFPVHATLDEALAETG
jgi:anti-anti-sigma factor